MNERSSRPRIGIDARIMNAAGGTGVSTYARSLLATLRLIDCSPVLVRDDGPRRMGLARFALALPRGARRLRPVPGDAEALAIPDIFRVAHSHFNTHGQLLPLVAPGPPGIMHWTYPVPLRLVGWRNIYTVHDAIPLLQPELTPIDPRRHARLLRAVVRHADAVVTVSDVARTAITGAMDVDPARVIDCGQPVIVPRRPLPEPPGLASRSYFLFCGSIEPRKNLAALAAAHRVSGTSLPLLLVGPDGWRTGEVMAAIGDRPGVVRLPYQDRGSLMRLIAHARAVLFPSLAEGFGLPVAEAMALGTPVMTSAGGALAETAGGAALLVDPHDIAAMAHAIAEIARNDALAANLIARGQRRAEAFSIAHFAKRLDVLYAAVREGPPAWRGA